MPTPNDLNAAYREYHDHPSYETTSVLCTMIRSYGRSIARNYRYYDVDEAADSILALAWAKLVTFRGQSSFTTWLHTLVRHRMLNLLRAQSRRPIIQVAHRERESPVSDTPLLDVSSLTHLSDDERHLVQLLVETPDYDRLAQSLCVSRKAICHRLDRISKKVDAARGMVAVSGV